MFCDQAKNYPRFFEKSKQKGGGATNAMAGQAL
jgi:hypothetical protein